MSGATPEITVQPAELTWYRKRVCSFIKKSFVKPTDIFVLAAVELYFATSLILRLCGTFWWGTILLGDLGEAREPHQSPLRKNRAVITTKSARQEPSEERSEKGQIGNIYCDNQPPEGLVKNSV